jgi:hypothetical protein
MNIPIDITENSFHDCSKNVSFRFAHAVLGNTALTNINEMKKIWNIAR